MSRKERFESYKTHPWLHKAYKKLKKDDLELIFKFIKDNEQLDNASFEFKINRLFLDCERPKNFSIILELLTCCNSSYETPQTK